MKKPVLDFEGQLHTVPLRNSKLRVVESESSDDKVVFEVELRYRGLIKNVAGFVRARQSKRYELKGISLEVFKKLDGRRNVEDLIEWLCKQEKLTFLEGRALVVQYLRDLMKRGLIVVGAEEDGD